MYIFGCLIDVTQYLFYLLSGMYVYVWIIRRRTVKKPLCYFSLKLEYTNLIFFCQKKFATQLAAGAAVVLLRTARKQQQSHHIASEALGPGKLILLESANIR